MWSVNTRPKPGSARDAARDSASTIPPLGWTWNCMDCSSGERAGLGVGSPQIAAGRGGGSGGHQLDAERVLLDRQRRPVDPEDGVVRDELPAAALGLRE